MTYAPKLVKRLAAALIVALAALVLVASADATQKKTRFVSTRYHYSLLLPGASSNWVKALALGNWTGASPPNADFDRLTDVKTGHWWLIAAQRVTKTMTLKKWTAYTIARPDPSCSLLRWRSNTKLGGAPARRYDLTCNGEGRVIAITALHAHRGYLFICMPKTGTTNRLATQHLCSTMKRTFHYTSR